MRACLCVCVCVCVCMHVYDQTPCKKMSLVYLWAKIVTPICIFCFCFAANNIGIFNSISQYLDNLLKIDNAYFEQMVNKIYPKELQLNHTDTSDTEVPFLDLNLSII